MTRFIVAVLATSVISAVGVSAQDQYPFKLGTFERQGRAFVGVVVRDAEVIDLAAALGSARKPPIFFKPGDTAVCTYEGVGTLSNPVVGPAPAGNH